MKLRSAHWINFGLAGAFSAVVLNFSWNPSQPQPAAEPGVAPGMAAPNALTRVFEKVKGLVSPGAAVAPSMEGPRRLCEAVRVPAVRDGHNYGWIQLPRGTAVEVLEVQGESLLIRYDNTILRMPQQSAEDGAVSLRKPRVPTTRI